MNDLIYVGAVALGAATLVVEAFRNFNAQSGQHPFSASPILADVEVKNLCTSGEIVAGFLFYASFYLLAYAVILGSTEVFDLIVSAMDARSQIGATDGDAFLNEDPLAATSSDYGRPLVVSALIIATLSVGVVRQVETTLRSLAHRLAGVPRGVYRVMDSLRSAPFDAFARDNPADLTSRFKESVGRAITEDEQKHYKDQLQDILFCLTTIDCLSAATHGSSRSHYFPQQKIDALAGLSKALDTELQSLDDEIDALRGDEGDTSKYWVRIKKFEPMAEQARANVVAVFAVLYVRNNSSVLSRMWVAPGRGARRMLPDGWAPPPPTPIERLREWIRQSQRIDLDSFAMALLIATVVGATLIFAVYMWWHGYLSVDDSAVKLFTSLSEETTTSFDECKVDTACRTLASKFYFDRQTSLVFTTTVWDTIHSASIVLLSVLFTLIGREIRLDEQSWQTGWTLKEIPFLNMLGLAIVPALLSIVASFAVALARLGWEINFQFTQSLLIGLIEGVGLFAILQAGTGLILSFAALVVMDRHNSVSAFRTLLSAIFFAIVCIIYLRLTIFVTYGGGTDAVGGMSRPLRETIILSTIPVTFIIVFALMLEFSEKDEEDRSTEGQ